MMKGRFYLSSIVTTAETAVIELSTTGNATNISSNEIEWNFSEKTKEEQIIRIIFIVTYLIIFTVGTIGNVLTFIVMQRGSLKHSSTCFCMAMLAVADSCKFYTFILPCIAIVPSIGSRGARGPCPLPGPVKISHKKDNCQRRTHRVHVSCPPYPAAGSATSSQLNSTRTSET